MNIVSNQLGDIMKVWGEQSEPDETGYDAIVFEYHKGRCWDVVNWMTEVRNKHSLLMVCCFNTNWGLAGTSLHCVVDSAGLYWFNDLDEMTRYVRDMVVGYD